MVYMAGATWRIHRFGVRASHTPMYQLTLCDLFFSILYFSHPHLDLFKIRLRFAPNVDMCASGSNCSVSGLLAPRHGYDAVVGTVSLCTSFYPKDTMVSELMFGQERRGRIIPLPPDAISTSKRWILPSSLGTQIE